MIDNLSFFSSYSLYAQGITKTDSYAFVEMADDKGFANITKDAVRLFGIHIEVAFRFTLLLIVLCLI